MPPVTQAKSTGMHSKRTRLRKAPYPSQGVIPTAPTDFPTGLTTALFTDVISVSVPGPIINDVKVTHLDSPDGYHEYVPGFGDGDTVTVTMNYSKANFVTCAGLLPKLAWNETDQTQTQIFGAPAHGRLLWEVEYPDGQQVRFIGHVKGLPVEVPDDDRITMQFPIKVSGAPVIVVPPPP